jgi:hypothetical protein
MKSGKSGTIQVEKGTATITTITRAKSGNLLVVRFDNKLFKIIFMKIFFDLFIPDCSTIKFHLE